MKFALSNGERQEAQPKLTGACIGCGAPMISKCGKEKIWHWAHKTKLECDPWWENETEWHRNWKGHFPKDWQEKIHFAEDGQKHIADVKTDKDWVLEFQYSAINPDERASRNAFYGKLVWVVNGLRRKKDPIQFFSSLKFIKNVEDPVFRRACDITSDKSAIFRDWSNNKAPVFFDFGEPEFLWCLLPLNSEGKAVVIEVFRKQFIQLHLANSISQNDLFSELFQFASSATSAEDLFLKFHYRRRAEERQKQLAAEEARRRNPYINRRASFRL